MLDLNGIHKVVLYQPSPRLRQQTFILSWASAFAKAMATDFHMKMGLSLRQGYG